MKTMKSTKFFAVWFLVLSITAFNEINPARELKITGRVTDSFDGTAITGAHVVVKGTSRGTLTNELGSYEILVPSTSSTLIFSYSGYANKEIKVGTKRVINVKLSGKQLQADMDDLKFEMADEAAPTIMGGQGNRRSKSAKMYSIGTALIAPYPSFKQEPAIIVDNPS